MEGGEEVAPGHPVPVLRRLAVAKSDRPFPCLQTWMSSRQGSGLER